MKLLTRDIIKLFSFLISIYIIKRIIYARILLVNIPDNFIEFLEESLNILPFFYIIYIGYKAALRISINITSINDCQTEYKDLVKELNEEEIKLKSKKIL